MSRRGISSYDQKSSMGKAIDTPVIAIKDLKDGKVNMANIDTKKIDPDAIDNSQKLNVGDVLISIKGSFRAALVDNESAGLLFTDNMTAIIVNKEIILPEVLVSYLNNSIGKKKLESLAIGATQKAISKARLLDMEIPVPTIHNQKKFLSFARLYQKYSETLIKEKDLLDEAFNTLLISTMEGT